MIESAISLHLDTPYLVSTRIEVAGYVVDLELSKFDAAKYYNLVGGMPLYQNMVEAFAHKAVFKFDGKYLEGEMPIHGP